MVSNNAKRGSNATTWGIQKCNRYFAKFQKGTSWSLFWPGMLAHHCIDRGDGGRAMVVMMMMMMMINMMLMGGRVKVQRSSSGS
jgi:hypothetical protein